MIVRELEKISNSERDIAWGNGQSRRFLTNADSMGYTVTDTTIEAGTCSLLEYKNHLETCYCIEGEGEVEVESSKDVYKIKPGVLYALNLNEKHYLRAHTKMRLVCVFMPALEGHERHKLNDEKSSCY